jgi:hypothetical protein
MNTLPFLAFSVALCLLVSLPAAAQDAKVLNRVAADKLEALLKNLKIDFKKSPHDKTKGAFRYEYERNDFKIRIVNFNGEDLWIESLFNDKLGLEEVNAWNVRAKFTRCVLIPAGEDKKLPVVSLEAQLDCFGGVTEGMIRQFIVRFDGELKEFANFISK